MRVDQPARDVTRGYTQSEAVARSRGAATTAGDLNESFMIGPFDPVDPDYATRPQAGKHFAANLWPERPAALRPVMTRYYREMSALAQTLMRLFALGLGLPETFTGASLMQVRSRRPGSWPKQTT
jgi:isopenicillin N synthase-like dioxygenase